jgi:hypothetical protein
MFDRVRPIVGENIKKGVKRLCHHHKVSAMSGSQEQAPSHLLE